MSRRNGNGGGGRRRSLQQTLRRRVVESCISRFSTAKEIINHLGSTYPEYQRINKQTLLRLVQDALALHSTATNNTASRSRKRRKNTDEEDGDDVRLQTMDLSMPSTSSDLASDDETSETSSDSTSENAPTFDLMKRTLRNSYKGTKAVPVAEEEKSVDLDAGNTSSTVNVGGCRVEGEAKRARKQVKGSVSNGGWRLKDFGWMKEDLEELRQKVITPLCHSHALRHLGLSLRPVTGILLHGPPGCGKTSLAQAIANETRLPFDHISAAEFVSGVSGASEENIRAVFTKARKRTTSSIIFVDEIDAIASKRENLQREMEKRIVTQLMTCMDQSNQPAADDDSDKPPRHVIVIGATNRPDALDRALRRPGRFDLEIYIGFPDEAAREDILSVRASSLKLKDSLDLRKIARSTPGFVGADLVDLVNNAGYLALNRTLGERKRKLELSQDFTSEHIEDLLKEPLVPEEIDKLAIKMSDFEEAVKKVQPSSRREGFSSIPNVKWEDVGGYDLIRQEFERFIVRRIKHPELYEVMSFETGFLLYGPPGCGKTLIAKAVANEAGANFIHVKGPELLTKYVGESELAVRTLFSRARTCAPCIIFFDEVDALTTTRGKEGGWVTERPLAQLLIELDGAEQRKGVFVIGATNRPEVMDPAVLRPGRFGKRLCVHLPSPDDRVLILKALARKKPIDAGVDLSAIGKACENFSGVDLAKLMNEAAIASIDEKVTSTEKTCDPWIFKPKHFDVALRKVSPSVSNMQRQHYQRLEENFKAA